MWHIISLHPGIRFHHSLDIWPAHQDNSPTCINYPVILEDIPFAPHILVTHSNPPYISYMRTPECLKFKVCSAKTLDVATSRTTSQSCQQQNQWGCLWQFIGCGLWEDLQRQDATILMAGSVSETSLRTEIDRFSWRFIHFDVGCNPIRHKENRAWNIKESNSASITYHKLRGFGSPEITLRTSQKLLHIDEMPDEEVTWLLLLRCLSMFTTFSLFL